MRQFAKSPSPSFSNPETWNTAWQVCQTVGRLWKFYFLLVQHSEGFENLGGQGWRCWPYHKIRELTYSSSLGKAIVKAKLPASEFVVWLQPWVFMSSLVVDHKRDQKQWGCLVFISIFTEADVCWWMTLRVIEVLSLWSPPEKWNEQAGTHWLCKVALGELLRCGMQYNDARMKPVSPL